MNLDTLIEKAIIDVKYYQERLRESETKLDAFYTARDAKSDNPYKLPEDIPNFKGCIDALDELKNLTK
tara:strand:+ start:153 stop:356 length:204 start_codon:yes stop_codon:yes gene_type:complete